jgi:hypothetical protein
MNIVVLTELAVGKFELIPLVRPPQVLKED